MVADRCQGVGCAEGAGGFHGGHARCPVAGQWAAGAGGAPHLPGPPAAAEEMLLLRQRGRRGCLAHANRGG
eukprot:15245428-Alexandrium_andersonii.AAC.1